MAMAQLNMTWQMDVKIRLLSRTQQNLSRILVSVLYAYYYSPDHICISSNSHCACLSRVFCNISV